jgi:hypothetical protein
MDRERVKALISADEKGRLSFGGIILDANKLSIVSQLALDNADDGVLLHDIDKFKSVIHPFTAVPEETDVVAKQQPLLSSQVHTENKEHGITDELSISQSGVYSRTRVLAHPCTCLPTNFNILLLNHQPMDYLQTSSRYEAAIAYHSTHAQLSIRALARRWDLPESTLRDRLKGKLSRREARAAQQLIPPSQEALLANWIYEQEACGQARSPAQIRAFVSILSKNSGGSGHVGPNWLPRYLQRWPHLQTKLGRGIDALRVRSITKDKVQDWYSQLEKVLKLKNIKGHNLWNFDETGTALSPVSNSRVVGTIATKTSYVAQPSNRQWCTAIEAISAIGQVLQPLLIFKGKSIQHQWFIAEETPDWRYTASTNAYTSNEIGLSWLREIFIPQSAKNLQPDEWRLLLLDGAKSHTTDEFMTLCYQNRIHCFYLIAHASHIFQPLDVGVFSSLKRSFRVLVEAEATRADFQGIPKHTFIQQYALARRQSITPANCIAGFKATGVWPFNPSKGLNSRFLLPEPVTSTPTTQLIPNSGVRQWDITMTPTNRLETNQAMQALLLPSQSDRTKRQIFRRTSTKIESLQFVLTKTTNELQRMKSIDTLRKRKLPGKRKVQPNAAFVTMYDILGTQNGSELALTPTVEANAHQIRREQGQGDAQDHAAHFGVITANLGSIVFR